MASKLNKFGDLDVHGASEDDEIQSCFTGNFFRATSKSGFVAKHYFVSNFTKPVNMNPLD